MIMLRHNEQTAIPPGLRQIIYQSAKERNQFFRNGGSDTLSAPQFSLGTATQSAPTVLSSLPLQTSISAVSSTTPLQEFIRVQSLQTTGVVQAQPAAPAVQAAVPTTTAVQPAPSTTPAVQPAPANNQGFNIRDVVDLLKATNRQPDRGSNSNNDSGNHGGKNPKWYTSKNNYNKGGNWKGNKFGK